MGNSLIRATRWLEGLYAALSFFFCLSLPWPPISPYTVLWLHFLATAVLALVLAWKLREGSRVHVALGVLLAAYVVINTGIRLPEVLEGTTQRSSVVLGLLPVALQFTAGVLLLVAWRRFQHLARAT